MSEIPKLSALLKRKIPTDIEPSKEEDDFFGKNDAYDELQAEIDSLREEKRKLEKEIHELKERKDIHNLRMNSYHLLFFLICVWLGFVSWYLMLVTYNLMWKIESSVIITLLTTSTATVLGMFGIAANWLFPKK